MRCQVPDCNYQKKKKKTRDESLRLSNVHHSLLLDFIEIIVLYITYQKKKKKRFCTLNTIMPRYKSSKWCGKGYRLSIVYPMLTNENEILTVGKSLCISFWLGIRVEFVLMSSALDLGNPNFQIDNYIDLSFWIFSTIECLCLHRIHTKWRQKSYE